MWASNDAGMPHLYHPDAANYCEQYRGGGHTDWRIPTIDELKSLYNKKLKNQNGYHITKFIDVGNDYVWADQNSWGGEAAFNFKSGSMVVGRSAASQHGLARHNNARALPVRSARGIKPRATNISRTKHTATSRDDANKTSTSEVGSQSKGDNTMPKKTAVTSLISGPKTSKKGEIARDGRFIAYNNGTVLDTKTNLVWASTDAGVSHQYHPDAANYCEQYRGGGHTDWRIPTIDELKSLYNRKLKNQNGYHITKFIDVGNDYVWADQNSWGGEAVFNFRLGSSSPVRSPDTGPSGMIGYADLHTNAHTLPVRTGK